MFRVPRVRDSVSRVCVYWRHAPHPIPPPRCTSLVTSRQWRTWNLLEIKPRKRGCCSNKRQDSHSASRRFFGSSSSSSSSCLSERPRKTRHRDTSSISPNTSSPSSVPTTRLQNRAVYGPRVRLVLRSQVRPVRPPVLRVVHGGLRGRRSSACAQVSPERQRRQLVRPSRPQCPERVSGRAQGGAAAGRGAVPADYRQRRGQKSSGGAGGEAVEMWRRIELVFKIFAYFFCFINSWFIIV